MHHSGPWLLTLLMHSTPAMTQQGCSRSTARSPGIATHLHRLPRDVNHHPRLHEQPVHRETAAHTPYRFDTGVDHVTHSRRGTLGLAADSLLPRLTCWEMWACPEARWAWV